MYQKSQSYDVWFLRYGVWQTEFFSTMDHFMPFYPLWTQKIKILKKWKNTWRYYHLTNVYHKQQSYHVWFLRYGVRLTHFFVILDSFLPFTPLTAQKIKIKKKWKKMPGDIIILHTCAKNYNQMMYGSWDMVCNRQTDKWQVTKRWVPHLKNKLCLKTVFKSYYFLIFNIWIFFQSHLCPQL